MFKICTLVYIHILYEISSMINLLFDCVLSFTSKEVNVTYEKWV